VPPRKTEPRPGPPGLFVVADTGHVRPSGASIGLVPPPTCKSRWRRYIVLDDTGPSSMLGARRFRDFVDGLLGSLQRPGDGFRPEWGGQRRSGNTGNFVRASATRCGSISAKSIVSSRDALTRTSPHGSITALSPIYRRPLLSPTRFTPTT